VCYIGNIAPEIYQKYGEYPTGGKGNKMDIQGNKNNHQHLSQTDNGKEPETLDDLLNFYNLGLEDETWQRIVRALAARGFPIKDEDLQISKR